MDILANLKPIKAPRSTTVDECSPRPDGSYDISWAWFKSSENGLHLPKIDLEWKKKSCSK